MESILNPLKHPYCDSGDAILLGGHAIYDVKQIHGLNELPPGLDAKRLLTLELPSIHLTDDEKKKRSHFPPAVLEDSFREFYLCYSHQLRFLFIVETEVQKWSQKYYTPQYGRDDNYDTREVTERIVWVYKPVSPRAKDPVIADHLKEYLA